MADDPLHVVEAWAHHPAWPMVSAVPPPGPMTQDALGCDVAVISEVCRTRLPDRLAALPDVVWGPDGSREVRLISGERWGLGGHSLGVVDASDVADALASGLRMAGSGDGREADQRALKRLVAESG